MPQSPRLLEPGQILAGRYRIERLLAQGGYGAVFVAEQLTTEARVAIKTLWPHLLHMEDSAERFALEAKVAGRVNSDFIVRVFDAGVDEQTSIPFLAMELLEGLSLAELVKQAGPLGLAKTAQYLSHVAKGLDRAHAYVDKQGKALPIVHRDLKPENLFLSHRQDGQAIVKILDFGLAKVVDGNATVSHGIKGTPLYMAYEQVSREPVGPGTDIWSFGLIAFFLLTGRSYWLSASREDVSTSAVFAEILHQPIVRPTLRARELGVDPPWPETFDAWFLKCVNRDSHSRFSSAGAALVALLEALLGTEWSDTSPELGPPPPAEQSTGPVVSRAGSASGEHLPVVTPPRSGTLSLPGRLIVAMALLVAVLGVATFRLRSAMEPRLGAGVAPLVPSVPVSKSAAPPRAEVDAPTAAADAAPPIPSGSGAAPATPPARAAAARAPARSKPAIRERPQVATEALKKGPQSPYVDDR